MRASGVLLPISSLPSAYGIGSFSKEAYEFVDQLKAGGQKYWQILPLGPTGYGDSPYQSFSTYAGNPYYIDLETLIEEGLLTKEECDACDFGDNPSYIDYEKIYYQRFSILRKAFARFEADEDFYDFVKENEFWLEDYSLYMAIKNSLDGISWNKWEERLKCRDAKALEQKKQELADEVQFIRFQQYEFAKQWQKLKAFANERGISIIGDIPIYVALTVQMRGQILSFSNLMKIQNPQQLPAVRRMLFQQRDNCGEILCIIGNIMLLRGLRGGYSV